MEIIIDEVRHLKESIRRLDKEVFMHDIINDGKTIVADNASLYNGNPSEKDVSCKLARMYWNLVECAVPQ